MRYWHFNKHRSSAVELGNLNDKILEIALLDVFKPIEGRKRGVMFEVFA